MSGIPPKKFAQDEYNHEISSDPHFEPPFEPELTAGELTAGVRTLDSAQMKRVYNQWVEINEIIQNGGDNKEELDNAIAKLQHYNGDKVRVNHVFSPELSYRIEDITARLENSSNKEQRSQPGEGNPYCCIVS